MVTGVEIGIIVTANYTFLNYLVLALGFLLLDDRFLVRFLPKGWATAVRKNLERPAEAAPKGDENGGSAMLSWVARGKAFARAGQIWISGLLMAWVFYASAALLLRGLLRTMPVPSGPVVALEPFRIANAYGLFG